MLNRGMSSIVIKELIICNSPYSHKQGKMAIKTSKDLGSFRALFHYITANMNISAGKRYILQPFVMLGL